MANNPWIKDFVAILIEFLPAQTGLEAPPLIFSLGITSSFEKKTPPKSLNP